MATAQATTILVEVEAPAVELTLSMTEAKLVRSVLSTVRWDMAATVSSLTRDEVKDAICSISNALHALGVPAGRLGVVLR